MSMNCMSIANLLEITSVGIKPVSYGKGVDEFKRETSIPLRILLFLKNYNQNLSRPTKSITVEYIR